MNDSSAVQLNIDVPATSSALVLVSDIPPIANREPDPTSTDVVASSVAAPLYVNVPVPSVL